MATFKEKFINALFGTPVQPKEVTPSVSYGQDVDNYLNTLGTQPYMQGLLNQPKEVGLGLDKYKEGVANGLNYGIPEIAKRQDELGIRKPQTEEEIYQARLGDFNQPTTLNVGTSNAPRQGGFLNDLASGFKENYTQGFNVDNLQPQNKGLATKIGEGVGTLAKFYDKPVGRGLLAGAIGLALGGGAGDVLATGLATGVGRQTNMTKDKAYRQGLINMGVDEAQVNAIPGIMTDDVFSNIARAKQLQDYALYRQDMIGTQRENAKTLNNYRMAQLAEDVKQNELENYYKGQQLAQDWEKINIDKDKNANTANDSQVVMNQLDELMKLHSKLPQHNAPRGTKKGVSAIIGGASDLGLRPDEVAAYEGVQNMMTNLVARKLAGEKGVMTDKDFDRAKKMLPNIYDTPQQAKAKYDALKLLYYANPKNVATSNTTSNNTTTQIGNYKVRVK